MSNTKFKLIKVIHTRDEEELEKVKEEADRRGITLTKCIRLSDGDKVVGEKLFNKKLDGIQSLLGI